MKAYLLAGGLALLAGCASNPNAVGKPATDGKQDKQGPQIPSPTLCMQKCQKLAKDDYTKCRATGQNENNCKNYYDQDIAECDLRCY